MHSLAKIIILLGVTMVLFGIGGCNRMDRLMGNSAQWWANEEVPVTLHGDYITNDGTDLTIGSKSIVISKPEAEHCQKKRFYKINVEDERIFTLHFFDGDNERGGFFDSELKSIATIVSPNKLSITGDCWEGKYTKKADGSRFANGRASSTATGRRRTKTN